MIFLLTDTSGKNTWEIWNCLERFFKQKVFSDSHMKVLHNSRGQGKAASEKILQTMKKNNSGKDVAGQISQPWPFFFFIWFFYFVFTIQGHNPCLAVQLACNWVTRQPWLEAAVVRGPRPPARAGSGEGQGHHSQSGDLTLMAFDRKEATPFAMLHNICNLPLPSLGLGELLSSGACTLGGRTRHAPNRRCPVVIPCILLLLLLLLQSSVSLRVLAAASFSLFFLSPSQDAANPLSSPL